MWFLMLACSTAPPSEAPSPLPTPVQTYDFSEARPWFGCPDAFAEGTVQVSAMEDVHQAFFELETREVVTEVTFPDGEWAQVGLLLDLRCPETGPCDSWDRTASLRLLDDAGDPEVELLRYITPYKRRMCAYVDLTDLQSELRGTRSLESWIDTWVGPGHPDGDGWRVSTTFVFTPGPVAGADAVVPIWPRQAVTVGDPGLPISDQLTPVTFDLPADATAVWAHLTTTGHGFGFTDNCAEFCPMENVLTVNGVELRSDPWRANCERNPIDNQLGTWEFDRNGWCPGAVAVGKRLDLTDVVVPGEANTLSFDIERNGAPFVNTVDQDGVPYTEVSLHLYVD